MTLATRTLADCEAVIERGLATFIEVASTLLEIRDGRLYKATHETFDSYCQERWGWGRAYAYRMIASGEVVTSMNGALADSMSPIGDILPVPTNEAQTRALGPLTSDPTAMADAWSEAVAETNGKPTAAAVEKAVAKRVEPKPITEAEQHELDRQGAIRRAIGRLEELVNGWLELRSLASHPERDAVLAGLIESDRLTVLEIESMYLEGSR